MARSRYERGTGCPGSSGLADLVGQRRDSDDKSSVGGSCTSLHRSSNRRPGSVAAQRCLACISDTRRGKQASPRRAPWASRANIPVWHAVRMPLRYAIHVPTFAEPHVLVELTVRADGQGWDGSGSSTRFPITVPLSSRVFAAAASLSGNVRARTGEIWPSSNKVKRARQSRSSGRRS